MRWHFHSPADAIFGQINRIPATFNHNSRRQSVAPSKKVKCDRCKRGGTGTGGGASTPASMSMGCYQKTTVKWKVHFQRITRRHKLNHPNNAFPSKKGNIFDYLFTRRPLFGFWKVIANWQTDEPFIMEFGYRYAHWYLFCPYVIIDGFISSGSLQIYAIFSHGFL